MLDDPRIQSLRQIADASDGLVFTRDLNAVGLQPRAVTRYRSSAPRGGSVGDQPGAGPPVGTPRSASAPRGGAGSEAAADGRQARQLVAVRRGVYAFDMPDLPEQRHILDSRAALACRSDATLSHTSAAVLHGLPVLRDRLRTVHVTAPTRRGRRSGVHSHGAPLVAGDILIVQGMPVTAVERTALDCALAFPLDEGVSIIDNALHRNLTTLSQLRTMLARLGHRHGLARAREALDKSDPASESPGESRVRLVLVRAHFSLEPQQNIYDAAGEFLARVDFRLKGLRVLIEFDGRAKYSLEGDAERAHWLEKKRHEALLDAGYEVVRVTWSDLAAPHRIVDRVRAAAARAAAARAAKRG